MAQNDPLQDFAERLAAALAPVAGVEADRVAPLLGEPPRSGMGDVALACHRLAGEAGRPPPELAARMAAEAATLDFVGEASAAGPFLNVTWDAAALATAVLDAVAATRAGRWGLAGGDEGVGHTVVIDFSSPNAARKLAFHHLRGTAVGAAVARLYEARGWRVVRLNFLGDYGHNMGQLLHKLDTVPDGEAAHIPPERLQALYVEVNEEERADPDTVKAAAGEWLARLETGEEVARRRWEAIVASTRDALDATYARLGVHFDEYRGESRYAAAALAVARSLVDAGVAEVDPDGGAIFVPKHDKLQPVVLVNRRGMSTYEARDAASAIERHDDFDFDRSLYLTDIGQGGRFRAVFGALGRAGYEWADRCEHAGFGQMRLGGRKAKTRSGDAVPLDEVLDEAEARAREEITAREVDLADPATVARQVGIGAVLFSQVRMRRQADFEFDVDAAVEFKGETAPRIQYQFARICSILRRGATTLDGALATGDPGLLDDDLEHRVLLAIGGVPAATVRAVDADDPSHLADVVIAVADAWAAYQTAGARERPDLRVLAEDPARRAARLRLAAATACAVRDGLHVLGVECPEEM